MKVEELIALLVDLKKDSEIVILEPEEELGTYDIVGLDYKKDENGEETVMLVLGAYCH